MNSYSKVIADYKSIRRKIMPEDSAVEFKGNEFLIISRRAPKEISQFIVDANLKASPKIDNKENKKVSLGLKQLEDTKKLQAIKNMKIGDKFTGEAIKILAFGAIIKLNNDAEGLLHISDATEDRRKSILNTIDDSM